MRKQVLDTAIELGYASKKIKSRKNHRLCILIDGMEKLLTSDNIDELLKLNFDYIIDACDDTKVKVALVKYAIKNNIHPQIVTEKNVSRFKSQLKSLGLSFDWSREINTTDPQYYKWTQWIFLKMFEKGLAYKSEATVNWCT